MKDEKLGALCSQCPLKDAAHVPTEYPVGGKARQGLIGFAPSRIEVQQQRPFVGPSGKILNTCLEVAQIDREKLLVTNIVNCQTPKNREPTLEEVECCKPRIVNEMKAAGVKEVMLHGKVPRDTFLPQFKDASVTASRAAWHYSEPGDFWAHTSWHPAYCLHGKPDAMIDIQYDYNRFKLGHKEPKAPNYKVLTTHKELEEVVKLLLAREEAVCVDIETTNRDMKRSTPDEWWNGYILCVGIQTRSADSGEPMLIISDELFNSKKSLKILQKLWENKYGVYGHNIKYDIQYIIQYYEEIWNYRPKIFLADDTMLMHYVLDENNRHGLKNLAAHYFNAPDWDVNILAHLTNKSKDSFSKVPREVLYRYLAYDVHYTVKLKELFVPMLEDEGLYDWPYKEVLMPATNIFVHTERQSLKLDLNKLEYARKTMQERVDGYVQRLRDIVGNPELNPNSTRQLAEIIYDKYGLKNTLKKKFVGARSTSKAVLVKMQKEVDNEFVDVLLLYRRWNKMLTTYANKLMTYVDKYNTCHFEFKLHGTETGRLSAGLLMTIPRKYTPEGKLLRDCFVADEGCVLIGADFNQSEMCWGGWYSQDPFLFSVYMNNRDLHTEVARAMYGENFTKEDRIHTKMFNFAYLYGGTEHSFARDSGLPLSVAKEWVARYDKNMKVLSAWKKATVEKVLTEGILRTPTGRKRRFLIVTKQNFWEIKNSSVNFQPSSISSDSTLMAFTKSSEKLLKYGWNAKPALFMHDGFYFMVKVEEGDLIETKKGFRAKPGCLVDKVSKLVYNEMIAAVELLMERGEREYPEFKGNKPIKFGVDMEVGVSWGDLEDLEML